MIGFIGPLYDGEGRCPFCGNDPLDDSLHAQTCKTVTESLCGVMIADEICLGPDDVDSDGFHHDHVYVQVKP